MAPFKKQVRLLGIEKQFYPGAGSWIWVPNSPKGIEQITQQLKWNKSKLSQGYYS
jgi:hypothetical protein